MIYRILVEDPQDPHGELIAYQVPEHSRASELLLSLLEDAGIEYVEIEPPVHPKTRARLAREAAADDAVDGSPDGTTTNSPGVQNDREN